MGKQFAISSEQLNLSVFSGAVDPRARDNPRVVFCFPRTEERPSCDGMAMNSSDQLRLDSRSVEFHRSTSRCICSIFAFLVTSYVP